MCKSEKRRKEESEMDEQLETLCKYIQSLYETFFYMANVLDQICINTADIEDQLERITDKLEEQQ